MPAETYFSYTNLTAFGNGYGFHLYNSSSLWTFNNNISATANHPAFGYESGIYGDKQYNCNTLVVNSGINSVYESGIHIEGNYNTLKIGAAGTVSGKDLAIRMLGDYSEIINDGTINGTAGSVEIVGNNYAAFTNNNKVLNVIKLKAKVISVVLGKNSYLAKQLTIDSAQGDVATIVNDGNAGTSPGVYVFFCGPGRETLINKGTINGAVNLDGGDDTFDNRGGKGTVIVDGGDDHDTFIVDTADVGINESIGKGVDTVQSTVTLSLSSLIYESEELEILTLIGSAAINGTGNDLDNTLTGNAAANVLQGLGGDDFLDGGAGADTLEGGLGNDIYQVDSPDTVVEAVNAGLDTVIASASHALAAGAHVERLEAAAGALNLALTGSGFANTIIGSAGHDTLDGGAGADRLEGGLGNDTYVVDSLDTVIDTGGIDTVKSAASFSIAALASIEKLTASGTAAINLTGNGLDNVMTGNTAANLLQGLDGNDTVNGDEGNDALYGGTGNDSLDGSMGNDVLDGGAGLDQLVGGTGNDKLYGGADMDTLYGGAGNDTLSGGTGKDVFVFDTRPNAKTNLDRIADFNVRDDSLFLDNAVFKKLGKGYPTKPYKLNKAFFTIGDKAKDANDYLVYNAKTGVLSYDIDGSGAKAMVAIATLKKGLKLTYADFFVI